MSASQEKKRRREARVEGTDKRQIQKQKDLKKKRTYKIVKNTVISALVVGLVVLVVFSSNLFYTAMPSLTVGDWKFTAVDYNYSYYSAYYQTYSSLYSTYGDNIKYLLDTSKPLSKQSYSDTQTWEDYFGEQALKSLKDSAVLCDAAKKAGFALNSDQLSEIETTITKMKTNYSSYGFKSFEAYLKGNYGKGMNEERLRENLKRVNLATYYSKQYSDALTYTQDQKDAYYDQNKDTYDLFSYHTYFVDSSTTANPGVDSDTAKTKAKATADAIAVARSEDVFADLVRQYAPADQKSTYEKDSATLKVDQPGSKLDSTIKSWLVDGSRSYGNTTVIESTGGYTVLMYVSREKSDYNMRSVRHILISVASDASDDDKSKAQQKAKDLLAEWKSGAATEDSFAALATANSADTGSGGGLYENIYIGQMDPNFESWCFDSSRKIGDTGIIQSSYGYHIMYYVGENGRYSDYVSENGLKKQDYNAWLDEDGKGYTVSKKFAFRFTK